MKPEVEQSPWELEKIMTQQVEKRTCGDCGVQPGEFHISGCDMERCPLCGGQAISCSCVYQVNGIDTETMEEVRPDIYHNGPTEEMEAACDIAIEKVGGRLPWTGEYPGSAECREFGWYSKWVNSSWVQCDASDPEANEDLNRLARSAKWDPVKRTWVKLF